MLSQEQLIILKSQVTDKYSGEFYYQKTLIPFFESKDAKDNIGYIFEAGGTNWRITKRTVSGKKITWDILGQGKESLIKYPNDKNSLEFYFGYLLEIVKKSNPEFQTVDFVGLIWSNSSIAEYSTIPGVQGIQLIADLSAGYNKNEGFIRDLEDKTNLGEVFLTIAKKYIKTNLLLMVNDSAILPCLDREVYHGGGVVSTGANSTTIVRIDNQLQHVNLESGFNIKFPNVFLSEEEREFFGTEDLPIEFISAGKFYGKIFALACNRYLGRKAFETLDSKNIQEVIDGNYSCFETVLSKDEIEKDRKLLNEAADQVCLRAAQASALILLSTVLTLKQSLPGQAYKIILESTVCRKSSNYFKYLNQEFSKLIGDTKAEIVLLELLKVGTEELAGPTEAIGSLADYWMTKIS